MILIIKHRNYLQLLKLAVLHVRQPDNNNKKIAVDISLRTSFCDHLMRRGNSEIHYSIELKGVEYLLQDIAC